MKHFFQIVAVLVLAVGLFSSGPGAAISKPVLFSDNATDIQEPPDALITDILAQVQERLLREHICQFQSAESGELCNAQGSRWSCDARAIDRALEYGRRHFETLGLPTRLIPYSLACRVGLSNNLEATLPGVDASNSEIVLITAHLDSTRSGISSSGGPAPGADDNASGSAAVLEAARVLSRYRFKHTIRFVLFTGEEQGLHGSRDYASQLAGEGAKIRGVFNMDMIGYDGDKNGIFEIQTQDEASRSLAELLQKTIRVYQMKLIPQLPEEAPEWSDHASFWRNGYPAVLVIEDSELGETDDFNPYYHTAGDTINAIDFSYMKQIVQTVLGAAAELAEPVR